MQDRYAGDLGDFLKFGLLRWLAPPGRPASPRLAVVWYRTANETHNADGKHIDYLDPVHRSSAYFRELDPDLYERLGRVVAGERNTGHIAPSYRTKAVKYAYLDEANAPCTRWRA